ncbi:MAG: glutamate--tRNA ligase family protein [Nanoarchaeota archaeon]
MKDLAREIKAYALKNAIDFGKADAGRILPKLFQHGLKKDEIKIVLPIVQKIVKEINSLSISDKKGEFEKFKNFVHEKIEEEKKLSELDKSGREMVFRLAPFPSGAMHLGNAKTYLLNALYAEKYGARVLLVMDDTIGSEEKQAVPEAYQLIEDAFEWLNVKYEKPVVYKSDRLDIYYSYGEKLIEKDKAYVCTCKQEKLRKNREEGKECECRNLKRDEQKKRWKAMFKGKEGSAVVRIKTSMQDKNPAFRDRVLFKISERAHPRVGKKYRVWPTLEMSWLLMIICLV